MILRGRRLRIVRYRNRSEAGLENHDSQNAFNPLAADTIALLGKRVNREIVRCRFVRLWSARRLKWAEKMRLSCRVSEDESVRLPEAVGLRLIGQALLRRHQRAVVVDRAAEAFFEIDLRLVAQMFAGLGDVGEAFADVAGAGGQMRGFHLGAELAVQVVDQLAAS